MSYIDELIAALSPDDVTYELLGDVTQNFDKLRRPITRALRAAGSYPYYGANGVQDYVADYIFDGTYLLIGEDGSVKQPDGTPVLNWATGRIWVNNHAHILQSKADRLDLRFLYYFLQTRDISSFVTGSTQLKLNQGNLNRIPVAVPPLEMQREIVRILDQFIKLEAELEVELEAELEARRQQYEHYRDRLLGGSENCPLVPLGGLGNFIRGNGMQKKDLREAGIPAIHYGQIHTYYGTWTDKTKSFVEPTFGGKLRTAEPGDLVIATTSEDNEAVGKAVAWLGKEPSAVSSDACIYRHSLDPRYVAYFFQTVEFQKQKERSITGTKVRRINSTSLEKIVIPVPDHDEQERIASALDYFDALVNDLSIGLSAELAARRKQYEYYRDQLLTFEEAPA